MRNLKKFLALVLAMMMVLSLMITVNAKELSDYADSDQVDDSYTLAVDILTQLKILEGSGGSFNPKDTLTRAEAAAIVYRVATGDVDDDQASIWAAVHNFTDITGSWTWADGYIGYAAAQGFVVGKGDNVFDPGGKITGVELLTIMLRVLGYDQNGEYQGTNWNSSILLQHAAQYGLIDGIPGDDLSLREPVSRQVMAQILFNAMQTNMVTWNGAYYVDAQKDLIALTCTLEHDDWGAPYDEWFAVWNKVPGHYDWAYVYSYDQVAQFAVAMDECDIIDEDKFDVVDGIVIEYYIDGNEQELTDTTASNYNPVFKTSRGAVDNQIRKLGVGYTTGGQGVITRIYYMGTNTRGTPLYNVVQIHTWLAKVTKVTESKLDKNGHPSAREIEVTAYVDNVRDEEENVIKVTVTKTNNVYSKNDYVLVRILNPTYTDGVMNQPAASKVSIVGRAPQVTTGVMSDYESAEYPDPATMTIGEEDYPENVEYFLNYHDADGKSNYIYYGDALDEWGETIDGGNIIGQAERSAPDAYALITGIRWSHSDVGSVRDGYALADLILDDGTPVNTVRIANINGTPAVNSVGAMAAFTDWTGSSGKYLSGVADNWKDNTIYYGHLWKYDANDDGSYDIWTVDNVGTHTDAGTDHIGAGDLGNRLIGGTHNDIPDDCNDNNIIDVGFDTTNTPAQKYGVITRGEANIVEVNNVALGSKSWTETYKARATNETVYMIEDEDGGFTVYIGKDKVPSTIGNICIVTEDNFAALVVVTGVYTPKAAASTGTFLAYVADIGVTATNDKQFNIASFGGTGNKNFTEVEVYKLGETRATKLYLSNTDISSDTSSAITAYVSDVFGSGKTIEKTGFYEFTIDESTNIIKAVAKTKTTYTGNADEALTDDYGKGNDMNLSAAAKSPLTGPTAKVTDTYNFVNVQVSKEIKAGTLYTQDNWAWTDGFNNVTPITAANLEDDSEWNFNIVTGMTKYIVVTKSNTDGNSTIDAEDAGVVEAGTADDVEVSDIVTIAYLTEDLGNGDVRLTAAYVYIFKAEGETDTPQVGGGDLKVVTNTGDPINGVELVNNSNSTDDAEMLKDRDPGAYQLTDMIDDPSDVGSDIEEVIFFVFYVDADNTAATLSIRKTNAQGAEVYRETLSTGTEAAKTNFFYVQVLGTTVSNAGNGSLKSAALTAGTYYWSIRAANNTLVSGYFTIAEE